MSIWLVFILGGALTYAIRLSFILLIGRKSVPPVIGQLLRFIPPAVLTAIIFPELFINQGQLNLSLGNSRLLAGVLAVLVAWRTRSPVLTIVVGMIALWALGWLSRVMVGG
jgi:branched-subunit amino acid transport protein